MTKDGHATPIQDAYSHGMTQQSLYETCRHYCVGRVLECKDHHPRAPRSWFDLTVLPIDDASQRWEK